MNKYFTCSDLDHGKKITVRTMRNNQMRILSEFKPGKMNKIHNNAFLWHSRNIVIAVIWNLCPKNVQYIIEEICVSSTLYSGQI